RPKWRDIVQSAIEAFLEIPDANTPSLFKQRQDKPMRRSSFPSFSLGIDDEKVIEKEKKWKRKYEKRRR
ncbi:hypothetical protein PIB30_086322, partial [Stylosanthes scabra]|nr:hypothetical protein [Stylosanthes scabra]